MLARRSKVLCLVLTTAMLAVGCASAPDEAGQTMEVEGSAPFPGKIASVTASIADDAEPPDRDTATRLGVADQIVEQVTTKLTQAGRYSDASDASLHVEINRLRVRDAALSTLMGIYSGSDFIAVEMTVSENGAPVKTYKTDTTSLQSGLFYISEQKRKNRLVETLTTRIVAGL